MPVACYIRENKLTTPPSYCCQTAAEETRGYDEIAEFIHLLNPSITAAQPKTVLLPAPLSGSIPFKNGLLLHKTKELLRVTPENAHTWVLPYEYSAEAQCPEFLKWLKTALDGDADSVRLIQAWFNALLTGRPDLQVFLHLIGPAGTGKSTLGWLAFVLVGKDNAITTKLKELESNRFETAGIYGRRLVAIEEADKYGGAVSVLKAMTGQDPLRLERKNQQQEGSFIYDGQTLMMSNERHRAQAHDGGVLPADKQGRAGRMEHTRRRGNDSPC